MRTAVVVVILILLSGGLTYLMMTGDGNGVADLASFRCPILTSTY